MVEKQQMIGKLVINMADGMRSSADLLMLIQYQWGKTIQEISRRNDACVELVAVNRS